MTSSPSRRGAWLRPGTALTALALTVGLLAGTGTSAQAERAIPAAAASHGSTSASSTTTAASARATAARARDPRKTRALYRDPKSSAAKQGPAYAAIGRRPAARWFTNEAYPQRKVTAAVRGHLTRSTKARRTATLVVYAIPHRDCGQYSSGGLANGKAYRRWVTAFARGIRAVRGSKPIVILEPDAIAQFGQSSCASPRDRLSLLRFATRTLTRAGAWVYLDAGHSNYTPYDTRPAMLKSAGVAYARGISTNVANFRTLADEKAYATLMVRQLRALGVRGTRYVVDTSRNGAADPVAGDVINPTWARLGVRPRLVFQGAFDGTLWVKNPGESDGNTNGGPAAGRWCDLLADRLLGRGEGNNC
ncbi:glycoside hydrolase family 6 protein [Nocardioides sp. 503]|uniref:glycoside hydrolase family 6 protein n=1 Tax=Nocardioides sp. 503 TaxID=2508326 RepID=UPI001430BB4E|nr:glycoside hydrolase family 6 protein [Nocardioides sp. 503]